MDKKNLKNYNVKNRGRVGWIEKRDSWMDRKKIDGWLVGSGGKDGWLDG